MSWIDHLEKHLLPCTVKSLTGIDCPGCGMQRAAVDLLRGDVVGSLAHNASLVPLLITLLYCSAHLLFGFRQGARILVGLFGATAAIMLIQYLVKLFSHL